MYEVFTKMQGELPPTGFNKIMRDGFKWLEWEGIRSERSAESTVVKCRQSITMKRSHVQMLKISQKDRVKCERRQKSGEAGAGCGSLLALEGVNV